jgi:glycosyltransferase involved in cell wall biosynthesis
MKRLLYLSVDGLLEPLGFSQVVRVIEGLAAKGWRYEVVSLEKRADLAKPERVRSVEQRLQAAGIRWSRLEWNDAGGARAAANNLAALTRAALHQTRQHRVDALHARSYVAAAAAQAVWLATKTPFVFDTRAYWIDERLEEGKWFTTPLRLAVARGLEHQLFACAAGVVTLTELQANDVRAGAFGPARDRPITCIPTCADYDDFVRRAPHACAAVPLAVRAQLRGKRVLGVIGSLNRSYCVDETLTLARLVLARDPTAHLLVLSAQTEAWTNALAQAQLPSSRVTIARANHDDMPQWLSLLEWGVLLLVPESRAKRASMPTKLAEFFATGVRPVQAGCNAEVSDWVTRAGSGVVLPTLDRGSLERAAEAIATPRPESELAEARARTQAHFSLASGVRRYDELWRAVFQGSAGLHSASS